MSTKTVRDFPELAAEWDFEMNCPLKPEDFSAGSSRKVYWICKNGHKYGPKAISERTRTDGKATGCPYCANKKVLPGYNDLETWCKQNGRMDLLEQWDNDKNDKQPSEFLPHTDKKAYWKCDNNHSYLMRICDKTKDHPYSCPICSNKQLLVGYNDLQTLFPELALEWDESNATSPKDHIPGDHTKVIWRCSKCGNKWETSIKERARDGTGCPHCSFYYKTSSPEQATFFYVKKVLPDAVNSYKLNDKTGLEIDIYIPSLAVGIEYDGKNWHGNKERDRKKSRLLKEQGIYLIRIKEQNDDNYYSDYCVIKSDYKDKLPELQGALTTLFQRLSDIAGTPIVTEIDLERDASEIYALSEGQKYEKSLLASGNVVLTEWAYDLNKDFTPDKVTPGSRKKAWWRCSKCGSVWQQPIKQKVKAGLGCEHCNKTEGNNKRVRKSIAEGKVKTVADHPELLKEWIDPRDPATITDGNDKPALWKCSVCGHEFKMIVKNRTGQRQGCPVCGRKRSAITRGRSVVNITTGEKFPSIAEAGRQTGISEATIRGCCNGKYKQAGGFKWKFEDKNR